MWRGQPDAGMAFMSDHGEEPAGDLMLRAWNMVPVVVADLKGRVCIVTPAAMSMFNWEREEDLVGHPVTEYVAPEDRDRAAANIARMVSGELVGPVQYRALLKSGAVIAIEVGGELIRGVDGSPTGLMLLVREMTERLRAEADIIQERSLLEALLENIPDHVYFKDADCRFVMISKAHAEMFGLTDPSQAVGKTDFDFFTEEHARLAYENELEIMRTGLPMVDFEEKETHLDGRETWVSTTKLVRTDKQGKTLGTLGISRDITKRKQAEEELAETNRALEEATARAESANKAKSDFLANMSHEIRTPINGIMGFTELTLLTPLEAEQRDNLETVRDCAESLLQIVDDILNFARIEAGHFELDPIPFSASECLRSSIRVIQPEALRKRLHVSCHVAESVPDALIGDATRLRQILVNLAGNAVKFTQQGDVSFSLAAGERSAGSVELHFTVSDTGIGIPKEKQATIFQTFQQGDSSITRRFGGTGLGLAICDRLVRLLGGTIWVESEPGAGSSFHFTARFKPLDTVSDRAEEPPPAPTGLAETPRLRILVADDNLVGRRLITRLLELCQHTVVPVSTGLEAVRSFENADYDLIILDVQMPDMDGLQAASAIRRMGERGQRIPILAFTACAVEGDAERCIAAGMNGYISKPIRLADLIAEIRKVTSAGAGSPCP